MFTIENNFCPESQGRFFLYGTNSFLCLLANRTRTGILVYMAPEINKAPNNQVHSPPLATRTSLDVVFIDPFDSLTIWTMHT